MYLCPYFIYTALIIPPCICRYPAVIQNVSKQAYEEKDNGMYRKSKKHKKYTENPGMQGVLNLISVLAPTAYNSQALKTITGLDAKKYTKDMIDSMITNCPHHQYKKNKAFFKWLYYYYDIY